jgi:hypothetical protein
MYLLKQKQQSRYCIPPHVRIQDALHVWHLASLPKGIAEQQQEYSYWLLLLLLLPCPRATL